MFLFYSCHLTGCICTFHRWSPEYANATNSLILCILPLYNAEKNECFGNSTQIIVFYALSIVCGCMNDRKCSKSTFFVSCLLKPTVVLLNKCGLCSFEWVPPYSADLSEFVVVITVFWILHSALDNKTVLLPELLEACCGIHLAKLFMYYFFRMSVEGG